MADVLLRPAPQRVARKWAYGFVRAQGQDYKISAQELVDIQASAQQGPSVLSREEWESSTCMIQDEPLEVGEVMEKNGMLYVRCAEHVENGRVIHTTLLCLPGEWSGNAMTAEVTVDAKVLEDATNRSLFNVRSLVNGVLTIEPKIALTAPDGTRI